MQKILHRFIICVGFVTFVNLPSKVVMSAESNNLSNHFKDGEIDAELYNNGEVVYLNKFQITSPRNKIIIFFANESSK